MIEYWVETSGENPELAGREAAAASEAVGGTALPAERAPPGAVGTAVQLVDDAAAARLVARLALARRCLRRLNDAEWEAWAGAAGRPGPGGVRASFRPLGRPTGGLNPVLERLVERWKGGGGAIDLNDPERRFWYVRDGTSLAWLGVEVAAVDRRLYADRRMPKLPYRRPVSLPPKLARVAANLARIRPGDRVVDPFVGTGALLAEAALLGARVTGIDRDPAMVLGTLTNFAHLGVVAERVRVGDAGDPFPPEEGARYDAVLTDPPYGRSSATHGEAPEALLLRALAPWADHVRPGGFLVVVTPEGAPTDLGGAWEPRESASDRVHRSLTREFRVYRRVS